MSARISQLFGFILVIVSFAMGYIVYQSAIQVGGDLGTLITSAIIAWCIVGLPEFVIGLWLMSRGSRGAKLDKVADELIPIVQKEGRVSVSVVAKKVDVSDAVVVDAAEKLSRRRIPLVYLDRGSYELVSPRSVELKESLLHLLFAQRRMTFDQIGQVTEASDEEIVEALRDLSTDGKFRGTIDEDSRVVFTKEAVEGLPKARTHCVNCGGKFPRPVLPGEEEVCPYCGHINVNRLDLN
jgi:hypothetical protein